MIIKGTMIQCFDQSEIIDQSSKQSRGNKTFPADISPEKALANMGLGFTNRSQQCFHSIYSAPSRILSFLAG
jgi:hypothetical protein